MLKLKKLTVIIIAVLSCAFFSVDTSAYEYDYGTEELYDAIPEEARDYIYENNIYPDGSGISELKPEDAINYIFELITYNIKQPVAMLTSLLAVIILSSLLKNMNGTENSAVSQAFSLVLSLSSALIIASFMSRVMNSISTAISSSSNFMLTYIPVLAGIIAVGGHTSTAAVFSSVMMISIEILTQITSNILFPLTSCLIGISTAGGLDKDLKIDKLGDGMKKVIIWGLGFIMTIFIGFLTLQSNISASADSVGLRAAKFAVSTSVPFVGSAVSDALSTVKTSIEVLKSGIGSFGIIVGCCVLFPVLINALCHRFFLFVAGILSEIFNSEDAGRMIKCGENVMSIAISMIICLFLFITISTTLMLIICRG